MKAYPHILFNGNCTEAINFYEKVFGASSEVMTFKEAPNELQKNIKDTNLNKIMYAELKKGDFIVTMADVDNSLSSTHDTIQISVQIETTEDANHIYENLLADGNAHIPADKTFFASFYAVVEDKFNIKWQLFVQKK